MNPFQRARDEARITRAKLAPGKDSEPIEAKDLLAAVEGVVGVCIEPVEPTYPDLGGGNAVLHREQKFIYVSKAVSEWGDRFCALVAHELGHWYLDATKAPTTVAHLKALFGSAGSPAVMKVEAYGARERQELQANVFARELLLPRDVALGLSRKGYGPAKVAAHLGIPQEFVHQQMLDALLLPEGEASVTALMPPSSDQSAAAEAVERFANVVAGPGTGKTSTLIHRVKYLVEKKKVDPSHILALTFTNKAAFELVERLRGAGIDHASDIWSGTFHAFGLEFLRKFHQYFELDPDLHVADRLTSMTMLAAVLPQLELKYYLRVQDPYDWLSPVVEGIKRLKEELVSPAEYRKRIAKLKTANDELQCRREDVATLYEVHEELLANRKAVDFVDLISRPALAIRADRAPYAELADKFQYILVDEYQDVTQAMVELLRQLAHKAKSLWVVGDIRQAIHHWRGASLKSLMKFDSEFRAQAGRSRIGKYALDTNRRSHAEILDLVQVVGKEHKLQSQMPLDAMTSLKGPCNEKPAVITCSRRLDVLSALADGVETLAKSGVPYAKQAVLCRSGGDTQAAAEALTSRGVPVVYIGELAQRPEVKKLLCLMQLLVERQPRALIGLMSEPELRMPMPDVRILLDAANSNVAYQRGRWVNNPPPGLSVAATKVISALRKLLGGRTHSSNPWEFVCHVLLEHHFALPMHSDTSVAAGVQRIALWQFAYAVRNGDGEMKEARLSRFLLRQRLRQRIGESYVDRELPPEAGALNGVRVQTVHASKGLEYEAVHVGYVNAGSYGSRRPTWFPEENTLDIVPPEVLGSNEAEYEFEAAVERNNLLYVAVSRAKRYLRLYQENEFGDDTLAPQLQHHPPKYREISYAGAPAANAVAKPVRAFDPPKSLSFEHFDTFALCALQYWYAQVLGLKREDEVDPAVRARWAIMRALKSVASSTPGTAIQHFSQAWADGNLPTQDQDPTLWRDADVAYKRGLQLVAALRADGGKFTEPESIVGGTTVRLPWGFMSKTQYSSKFAMVRFTRRRVEDIKTLLKPMVSGLVVQGTRTMQLNHVLSAKVDDVPAAKRVEATKSFKAAVRLLDGDNRPSKGRHCGRCAYLTICPSAPTLAQNT